MTFLNIDGSKAEFSRKVYYEFVNDIVLPKYLDEMIEISKILSKEFPFVRVDFFEIEGRILFSEMTFTPGGGFMTIDPEEYLQKWGKMIKIDKLIKSKN